MLLRFQTSNHRSILESVELSMVAVDEDRAHDSWLRTPVGAGADGRRHLRI